MKIVLTNRAVAWTQMYFRLCGQEKTEKQKKQTNNNDNNNNNNKNSKKKR